MSVAAGSACTGGGGPADRSAGLVIDAPGEVADCQPCLAVVDPGAASWAFRFEVAEVAGRGRVVRRVVVTPPGRHGAPQQVLDVPDMAPLPPGQGFYFGPQDIDLDGHADLLLATDRGVANAYARYWRFEPARMVFVELGTFPLLAVDPATRRITSYERAGGGGQGSTRTEYGWRGGRLRQVRVEVLHRPPHDPGAQR